MHQIPQIYLLEDPNRQEVKNTTVFIHSDLKICERICKAFGTNPGFQSKKKLTSPGTLNLMMDKQSIVNMVCRKTGVDLPVSYTDFEYSICHIVSYEINSQL